MQTEDEQIAQLKDWWDRNGKPLLAGGVLALVAVFGWQGWQKYQVNQAQSASVIYQQLLETALDPGRQARRREGCRTGRQARQRVWR